MRNFIKNNKAAIAIFLLALAVRLMLFSINLQHNHSRLFPTIHGDDGYYELSQNILAGRGFSSNIIPLYMPNPLRPPLWPGLIALIAFVFRSYWAVAFFEIGIASLIPVMGLWIARKIIDKRFVWLGTGILLALEPYGVLFSHLLYSETMFTFLFLSSLIFLIKFFDAKRTADLILMTICLGLATLVKPTIQYVPIILPLLLMWESRKALSKKIFIQIGLFLAGFLLIIFPWLYRNYQVFGVWGMGAQPAFNLYVYLVPTVLSIDNHTNFKTELETFVLKPDFDENDITLATSDYYRSQAVAVIRQHKMALVKSVITTIITFFTHDGMLTVFQYSGITFPNVLTKPALTLLVQEPLTLLKAIGLYMRSGGIIILLMRLVWILITLFFVIGSIIFLKKEQLRSFTLFALILVAYFAVTTSINGLGVNARFRVPVNTFIFTFALYGFLVVWGNIRTKLRKIHA